MKALKTSFIWLLIIAMFSLTSCGESGKNIEIEGINGPHIYLEGDTLLITAILENVHMEGGGRFPINKYPGSYLELSPDLQSGGTLIAFNIAVKDVLDGNIANLDPQTLPGGRNLPGVVGGKLPAVAMTIESFNNISLYAGGDVFGIFLPFELNAQGAIITFRYYTGSNRAGNISLVGADSNGENSGILLMLDLKTQTKKYLKRIARK